MSFWQYQASINGYIEANTVVDDTSLTDEEVKELGDWIDHG